MHVTTWLTTHLAPADVPFLILTTPDTRASLVCVQPVNQQLWTTTQPTGTPPSMPMLVGVVLMAGRVLTMMNRRVVTPQRWLMLRKQVPLSLIITAI